MASIRPVLLVSLAVAGCGGEEVAMTPMEKARLRMLVEQARDGEAARGALRELRSEVARLQRSGALDDTTARRMRMIAVRAGRLLPPEPTPEPQPADPARDRPLLPLRGEGDG